MGEVKRCAACGKENPVSEMKVCMQHQMHRYVCDSKCMTDFYNQPKKPTAAELEAKVATLEAENAKLRAELERRAVDGCLIVPIQPTEEMRKRAQDYLAAEGMIVSDWLIHTSYREMLAAAPSAPKADDPVKLNADRYLWLKANWHGFEHYRKATGTVANLDREIDEQIAIAAARQEGGKV